MTSLCYNTNSGEAPEISVCGLHKLALGRRNNIPFITTTTIKMKFDLLAELKRQLREESRGLVKIEGTDRLNTESAKKTTIKVPKQFRNRKGKALYKMQKWESEDYIPQSSDEVLDTLYDALESAPHEYISIANLANSIFVVCRKVYAKDVTVIADLVLLVLNHMPSREKARTVLKRMETLLNDFVIVSPQGNENPMDEFMSKLSFFNNGEFVANFKKLVVTISSVLLAGETYFPNWWIEKFTTMSKGVFDLEKCSSLLEVLLRTLHFVATRMWQCIVLHSIEPLIHSEGEYIKWVDGVKEAIDDKFKLVNPQAFNLDFFKYGEKINAFIVNGECMYKRVPNKKSKEIIRGYLNQLREISASITCQSECAKTRRAPFALEVFGQSSIAKSLFLDMLYYHYGKVRGLDTADHFRYNKNPSEKYWSGFTSHMWCTVFDDIAYLNPDKSSDVDPSLAEIIKAINNMPFCPDQAALEHKGKTPFLSELVLCTTNTVTLNAEAYFSHPFAVQRRMQWAINLEPKAQYKGVCGMIDTQKIPPSKAGEYPDLWDITVYAILPDMLKYKDAMADILHPVAVHARYKPLKKFNDVYEFIQWYTDEIKANRMKQDSVKAAVTTMANVQLCLGCNLPESKCTGLSPMCPSFIPQGSDMWFYMVCWCAFVTCFAMWRDRVGRIVSKLFDQFVGDRAKIIWYCFCLCIFDIVGAHSSRSGYHRVWRFSEGQIFNYRRKLLGTSGHYLFSSLCTNPLVQVIAIGVGFFLGAKMLQSLSSTTLQGNAFSGNHPKPDVGVRPDVYRREVQPISTFDLPNVSLSWAKMSKEQVLAMISKNVYNIRVLYERDNERRISTTTCLGLAGNLFVANAHALPLHDQIVEVTVSKIGFSGGVGVRSTFTMCNDEFHDVPNTDLCGFIVRSIPPVKDIRGLLLDITELPSCCWDGSICLNREGVETSIEFKGAHSTKMSTSFSVPTVSRNVTYESTPVWEAKSKDRTINGDCGSPYVAFTTKGPIILGIHMAEKDSVFNRHIICMTLVKNSVDYLISSFEHCVLHGGVPKTELAGFSKPLTDLHPKSHIRFIKEGNCDVFGSIIGGRSHGKATVKRSLAFNALKERGYKGSFACPTLGHWKSWKQALKPIVEKKHTFDPYVLRDVVDCMVREFSNADLSVLEKYSLDVSINGADGVAFVNGVNRNSSMGYPINKTARYFQVDLDNDRIEYTREILAEVQAIDDCYKNKMLYCPVFSASEKDEPRKQSKIDTHSNRVFMGSPRPFLLYARMYLLSFIRLVQWDRYLFEAGPGLCAQSIEWMELYEYLTTFGEDRIVAGDFKDFDKNQSCDILWCAFEIIIRLHKEAGWPQEDIDRLYCIAADTIYTFVNFDGTLLRFFGSNPSGQPLTVIVNGLVNGIYMRYAYYKANGECDSFKENVHLMTYGDDNIMGVKEGTVFNHCVIQECMAEVGIVYTMADKDAESVPFIHISESSFLKRSFRFDANTGHYMAALDENSIIDKGVMVGIESIMLSNEEWTLVKIQCAVREFFFHGEAVFEDRRKMFLEILLEIHLASTESEARKLLPTYNDCLMAYYANSFIEAQSEDICDYCKSSCCQCNLPTHRREICWCCNTCKEVNTSCCACETSPDVCPCTTTCAVCDEPFVSIESSVGPFSLFGVRVFVHVGCCGQDLE